MSSGLFYAPMRKILRAHPPSTFRYFTDTNRRCCRLCHRTSGESHLKRVACFNNAYVSVFIFTADFILCSADDARAQHISLNRNKADAGPDLFWFIRDHTMVFIC